MWSTSAENGFLWDPILGELNWEANLERGEKQESAQSFLLQAGKTGVESWSELFDQWTEKRLLRNFLGFGELDMEEKHILFYSQLKFMMVRCWISIVGQVGQQA